MLNRNRICQNSLTKNWIAELWKKLKLLHRNIILILTFCLWLLNQMLLSRKSNIDIMPIQIHNLFDKLNLPTLQMFMKRFLKLNVLMLNQLKFRKRSVSSKKTNNDFNHTELINLNNLKLKLWWKFSRASTLHISPVQKCNWVWKQCNTLLMNCNLLSYYSNKSLLKTSFPKFDTDIFSLSKISFISNMKEFFHKIHDFIHQKNDPYSLKKSFKREISIHLCFLMISFIKDFQKILTFN